MKKTVLALGIIVSAAITVGQDIQHEAVAINIEVPVRVFKGDTFIDNLNIEDFEVYEDGELQAIEAVYLIKKTKIEREETEIDKTVARKKFVPQISSRLFVLFFEIIDYSPKLGEVIDYFFNEVFTQGDSLIVVTPLKTYEFTSEVLRNKRLEHVASELKSILKKDTKLGNAEYKSIIRDILAGWATPFEYLRLKTLRYLEESKLLGFADYLKDVEGQKHVFLFFQKGVIPERASGPGALEEAPYHDFMGIDVTFNSNKVKQAFSDSLITAHFLFLTNTDLMAIDITVQSGGFFEMSEEGTTKNVFAAFSEVSKATGGLRESSANPASIFKKAVTASENYYLLYYTPKDYVSDGKFRNIKVRIKGKNYRVLHRAGYLAD
jgi:hypothetical protein